MTPDPTERLTLRLSPEARETLKWIAEARGGVPFAEVIRRALGTERILVESRLNGGKVFIEPSAGGTKELVLV